jgi:hypothetical protein
VAERRALLPPARQRSGQLSESTRNEHIKLRLRLASLEAELIARTHEQTARSLALLRQPVPSTFLGEQREPDYQDQIGITTSSAIRQACSRPGTELTFLRLEVP